MDMRIEKAWNGYIVNNGTMQTEIYKTLEEALNRAREIFDWSHQRRKGLPSSMTLAEYFRICANQGAIDHSLRAEVRGAEVKFYIHPEGRDGITRDFVTGDQHIVPDPAVTYPGGDPDAALIKDLRKDGAPSATPCSGFGFEEQMGMQMCIDQQSRDIEELQAEKRKLQDLLLKARDFIEFSPIYGAPTTNLVVEIDEATKEFKREGQWRTTSVPEYPGSALGLTIEKFEFDPYSGAAPAGKDGE